MFLQADRHDRDCPAKGTADANANSCAGGEVEPQERDHSLLARRQRDDEGPSGRGIRCAPRFRTSLDRPDGGRGGALRREFRRPRSRRDEAARGGSQWRAARLMS
jgi:hypothetical protein